MSVLCSLLVALISTTDASAQVPPDALLRDARGQRSLEVRPAGTRLARAAPAARHEKKKLALDEDADDDDRDPEIAEIENGMEADLKVHQDQEDVIPILSLWYSVMNPLSHKQAGQDPPHSHEDQQNQHDSPDSIAETQVQVNLTLVAHRSERRACKHWQHMGCMLDAMEKTCEPDEGSNIVSSLVDQQSRESLWMCCCPLPYQPCDESKRDATCHAAMIKHIGALTEVSDSPTQPQFMSAVQQLRGELRNEGGTACQAVAPALPESTCGYAGKPKVTRSIQRADLFCEMLSWQFEELGDGNPSEFAQNGCPYISKNKGLEGDNRKGNFPDGH